MKHGRKVLILMWTICFCWAANAQSLLNSPPPYGSGSRNNTVTYLSLGLGLVAGGAGYYFYDKANKTYDDYKEAITKKDATDLFDETEKYDQNAKICAAVGGGLVVFGIVRLLMSNQNSRASNQESLFALEPVQKRNFSGISLSVHLLPNRQSH